MQRKVITILLAAVAAALLFVSVKLPVWQMRMEAPQYKDEEALKVKVYPNALRGDLQEIKVLNSYIGVHIPEKLPQTEWLPIVLFAGGIAGLVTAFLPDRLRKKGLVLIPIGIGVALLLAAGQAQWQMHEIGTNRDKKSKLVGVKDFTAPLIGRTKIAQFTITSFLSWGSLTIASALGMQLIGAWLSRSPKDPRLPEPPPDLAPGLAANPQ